MFNTSKITAIAKSGFIDGRVYTHLIPMSEIGPEIFLTNNVLKQSGFTSEMVKADIELVITLKYDEQKRPRAATVHSVGGRLPNTSEPVPVTIDQFLKPIKAGENSATGEVLWRICDTVDQFVQYVVCDSEGNLLRQLGCITSNDARKNMGLEVKAAKARVARRRDKIVVISKLMAAE